MYPFVIIGEDLINNGKIVDVTCPNAQVKKIVVRFKNETPSEIEISEAVSVAVNEIQESYDDGSIVF